MARSEAELTLVMQLKDEMSKGLGDIASKGGFLKDALSFAAGGLLTGGIGLLVSNVDDLAGGLVNAAKAADEEAAGMARLNTTISNSIPGIENFSEGVEDYITKQQDLAFADDALRDSLGFLVGQTKDLGEAQELQATAMDLARAKNIDLMTATKAVGKVDQDSIGILKKLGVQVTDNMTKEEALRAIREQSAGQAEAYANTAGGAMERLQTTFGNITEEIGGVLLPKVTEALGGVADFFSSPEVQGAIGQGIQFLIDNFTNFINLLQQVAAFFAPLIPPIQQFFAAIQSGQSPLEAFKGLVGEIGPIVMDMAGQVLQAVGDALPGIIDTLLQWGQAFIDWIGPKIPDILAKLWEMAQAIGSWILDTALPWLIDHLLEWGKAFIDWVGPQIPIWLQEAGKFLVAMGDWIWNTALPNLISKLAEWGKAFWEWVSPQIFPMLGELGGLLLELGKWIITDALPNIIGKLGEWGWAFINWVAKDALPWIIQKLNELRDKITTWIFTEALPALITKLQEWGKAFVDWVTQEAIPNIGAKLNEFKDTVFKWIGEQVTNFLNKAKEIGGGIVDGIKQGIQNAWNTLTGWLQGLVQGLIDNITSMFGGGSSTSGNGGGANMSFGRNAPLVAGALAGVGFGGSRSVSNIYLTVYAGVGANGKQIGQDIVSVLSTSLEGRKSLRQRPAVQARGG